ncbi:unnamed protein product [Blepharisma stoltei]|uniref:Uncharacterized protein n=1 Tax=Blepharisma stoltei TaxID=1481888 RepID=A0AAU9JLZ6_9CILI|nr:unnamed protein product [Blepharisma stoltei]
MVKLPSIKVSFKNEFHIIAPVPSLFCKLCLTIKETIPDVPLNPNIYYLDAEGDRIKLLNDKGYGFYLRTFQSQLTKKLYIEDSQNPPENNKIPSVSLPIKRPSDAEENDDSPTKFQKIDNSEFNTFDDTDQIYIPKSRGPNKSRKVPSEIQRIVLDTFDIPSKKMDNENKQLLPIIEAEINQFILDAEGNSKIPNLVQYITSTEFLSAVRNTIRDTVEKHGFVNTALLYKIPLELCVHILYDSKVHIESDKEREKYKKYIDSCLPKEISQFTPKFCLLLTQQLNNGDINKQNIMATYDVDEDTIEIWRKVFLNPQKSHPANDPYPRTFRIQLVRDYLEGNFDKETIKNYFGVDQETIENWIYLELEEKEEIVMEIHRKRLSRAEKEEIVDKYLEKKLTYKEIKAKYGVCQREVDKWVISKQSGQGLRDSYHGSKASAIMDQAYRFLEFGS